jgi:PKD repeat protein
VLTFRAHAGTTYYFQLGSFYGTGGPDFHINLSVAPPPQPSFYFNPGDPSVFDSVQFFDNSSDPGQAAFASETWDFGDGANTANPGCCPNHHYAVDGDYTVKLDVTTTDGRTASTSQVVHVRTHDVAITNLVVPRSARVGRTQKLTVGVSNQRYPENVQVDLYRSTPAGLVRFGSLTQTVPVRPRRRTTDFVFSYTFTSDDAAVGKVTFKAVATIVDARDALQSDNESVAPPTKVTA